MSGEETKTGHLHAPLMSGEENLKKEETLNVESRYGIRKAKILYTVFVYVVFIFHGINVNLLGPSLIDLEYLTNSSTSSIATVFTWRYGSFFLGTTIAGPIVDSVNEFLVIGVALCLTAVATFLTPTWRQLLGLFITTGVSGIGMACIAVGTSATILAIWGQDAKPYQQALHFFVTIGWTLSPQLVKPFLRMTTRENDNGNSTSDNVNDTTYKDANVTMVSLGNISGSLIQHRDMSSVSHIQYAYIIVASCLTVLSVSSFMIVVSSGCQLRKKSSQECSDERRISIVDGKARIVMLILLFCQVCMYGGIELAFTSLTMTFVVKYLKMSKSLGSDISTLFTAMMSTSRGLCVILSKFVHPSKLLVIQLVILTTGTLTIAFAVRLHWIVPWIGFAAAGLGTGSLFPTLINWTHGYMTVKGKEISLLYSGYAFSAMAVPPLIGFLFERLNPMWFAYITLVLTSLFILLFLVNSLIVRSLLKDGEEELSEDNELRKL